MQLNTIKEADLKGKRVLIRVDFNVPLKNGVVTDNTRIKAALPTVQYILEQGASLVVMSHFGRPKFLNGSYRKGIREASRQACQARF